MSGWMGQPVLAFDLETTGINADADTRIATAAAVIVADGEPTYTREWTIAIDIDMPDTASAVNGLTTEWLRANGRPAAEVIPEIVKALRYAITSRMPIVAFNGCFDFTFTDRECRRWMSQSLEDALGAPVFPVLDPFVCWKAMDTYRPGGRKLVDACKAYGIELGDDAHSAGPDAIAAARVMVALGKKYRHLASMTLPQLHLAQVGWRKSQCDSLRDYFNKKGTEHDGIPVEWPMLPYAAQGALL